MAETLLTNSEWYVLDCLWERAPRRSPSWSPF